MFGHTKFAAKIPSADRRELAEVGLSAVNRSGRSRLFVLLACAIAVCQPLWAGEPPRDLRDLKVFRFEFDNDSFLGSDDAFSAGWSIQVHSPLLDRWPVGLAGWIGRFPGLHEDGDNGRIVRWSWGITQLLVTPRNVTIAAPRPGDAPWAGLLGGYGSWTAYDDRRLAALQVYVGCIGPCSLAEGAQKFVHNDLHFGDDPKGWPNQLDNRALFNLNYEYRHRMWSSGARNESRGWRSDISVGTQAGVGSFATYTEAWIEYRFGWDVPAGFTKFADPPALGVALDPIYIDPKSPRAVRRSWRPYFTVVARIRNIERFVITDGGATENGGYYARITRNPGHEQVIVGIHFAKQRLAFDLMYYHYVDGDVIGLSKLDWVNVSFERRF